MTRFVARRLLAMIALIIAISLITFLLFIVVLPGGNPAGQIAGRLVNISAESGFDPTAPGDGGSSYGLFQDHNTRLAGLRRWAGTFNPTIQQQLDYEWAEEQPGGERAVAGAALRATTDATQTAMIFSGGIEGPKAGIPEA